MRSLGGNVASRLGFEPAVVLPHQYRWGDRRAWTGPERLMAAVLQDAIALVCGDREGGDTADRRVVRSAERWIHSEDTRRPFSFLRICEALGLDPGCTRRAVHLAGSHAVQGRLGARIRARQRRC